MTRDVAESLSPPPVDRVIASAPAGSRRQPLRTGARELAIVWIVVLIGLSIRSRGLDTPITDPREAHSAMIAMNIREDGVRGLFFPRLDYAWRGPGYLLQEFPIVTGLGALGQWAFDTDEEWPLRVPSLAFYVVAILAVWRLTRSYAGAFGGVAAAVLFSLFPLSVTESASPMTDVAGMALCVSALALARRFALTGLAGPLFGAATCAGAGFLCKAPNLYFLLPLVSILMPSAGRHSRSLIGAALLALTPIALWLAHSNVVNASSELWIGRTARDACAAYLFQKGRIGFYASWEWYVRLGEHLVRGLTPVGVGVLLAGVAFASKGGEGRTLTWAWGVGILASIVILPFAFFSFGYYMLALVPLAAFVGGCLAAALARRWGTARSSLALAAAGLGIGLVGMPAAIRGLESERTHLISFGEAARRIVPERTKLVVSAFKMPSFDCSLLYQSRREGWRFAAFSLDDSDPTHRAGLAGEMRKRLSEGRTRHAVPPAYTARENLTPTVLEELRRRGASFFAYSGSAKEWIEAEPVLSKHLLSRFVIAEVSSEWLFIDLRFPMEAGPPQSGAAAAADVHNGFASVGRATPIGGDIGGEGEIVVWEAVSSMGSRDLPAAEPASPDAAHPFGGHIHGSWLEPGLRLFERRRASD